MKAITLAEKILALTTETTTEEINKSLNDIETAEATYGILWGFNKLNDKDLDFYLLKKKALDFILEIRESKDFFMVELLANRLNLDEVKEVPT